MRVLTEMRAHEEKSFEDGGPNELPRHVTRYSRTYARRVARRWFWRARAEQPAAPQKTTDSTLAGA